MEAEFRRNKLALMALWELIEQNELVPHYAAGEQRMVQRIEEEVINPIYSAEDSSSWVLELDEVEKGGAF